MKYNMKKIDVVGCNIDMHGGTFKAVFRLGV